MAFYISIFRLRVPTGPGPAREAFASVMTDFSAWAPPEGLTLHGVWVSLDNTTAYAVVESDDPRAVAQVSATFAPHGDYEIVAALPVEETFAVWAAAGLVPST